MLYCALVVGGDSVRKGVGEGWGDDERGDDESGGEGKGEARPSKDFFFCLGGGDMDHHFSFVVNHGKKNARWEWKG